MSTRIFPTPPPAVPHPPRQKLPGTILMAALAIAFPISAGAATYDSVVVINEVNYHPVAAGDVEWLELRNLQGVDMNLSNWSLAGGISFNFPAALTVPGGGYIILASAAGKFPGALGPFTGSLNNSGDTIRLLNQNGRIMDELNYQDSGDWPTGPDGTGVTLSRRKASAGDAPGRWTSSHEIGGTPGRHNFAEAQNAPARVRLVGTNATWSFLDTGATPPGRMEVQRFRHQQLERWSGHFPEPRSHRRRVAAGSQCALHGPHRLVGVEGNHRHFRLQRHHHPALRHPAKWRHLGQRSRPGAGGGIRWGG